MVRINAPYGLRANTKYCNYCINLLIYSCFIVLKLFRCSNGGVVMGPCSFGTQVLKYCSKLYICAAVLIVISAILTLYYFCVYQFPYNNTNNIKFMPIMVGGQLFLALTLLMIPRFLLDIIKFFYTGRINSSKLKENHLLRFICSDNFFLDLPKNSKLSLEDRIIDILTILLLITEFVLLFIVPCLSNRV